jgi:NAD(P)-dependent dehydrogenase (short-subunit alcohol dehydrogenase family)
MASFTLKRDSLHGLKGKTVLITGGSSGFGLESAKLLLSLSTDNRVAILDRAPLPASFRYNPERVFFRKVDITSWNAQRDAFAAAIEKFKGLDAVFVNAGMSEERHTRSIAIDWSRNRFRRRPILYRQLRH